jgi:hypothetical protein
MSPDFTELPIITERKYAHKVEKILRQPLPDDANLRQNSSRNPEGV